MLDFNTQLQLDFLRWIQWGALEIFLFDRSNLPRIVQLTEKYADSPMDLADATLLVISDVEGSREIITIDTDFFM